MADSINHVLAWKPPQHAFGGCGRCVSVEASWREHAFVVVLILPIGPRGVCVQSESYHEWFCRGRSLAVSKRCEYSVNAALREGILHGRQTRPWPLPNDTSDIIGFGLDRRPLFRPNQIDSTEGSFPGRHPAWVTDSPVTPGRHPAWAADSPVTPAKDTSDIIGFGLNRRLYSDQTRFYWRG